MRRIISPMLQFPAKSRSRGWAWCRCVTKTCSNRAPCTKYWCLFILMMRLIQTLRVCPNPYVVCLGLPESSARYLPDPGPFELALHLGTFILVRTNKGPAGMLLYPSSFLLPGPGCHSFFLFSAIRAKISRRPSVHFPEAFSDFAARFRGL